MRVGFMRSSKRWRPPISSSGARAAGRARGQDVETVEYFFAHTVAPAIVAVLVPCAVLAWLASSAWPLALALAPFLAYAGASPFLRRGLVDGLASRSRAALGELSAHVTDTIQGMPEILAFGPTQTLDVL
jgi:ATP-binding cassette subfamily C protein CydCD